MRIDNQVACHRERRNREAELVETIATQETIRYSQPAMALDVPATIRALHVAKDA
jgi:hypothetical protein